MKRLGQCFILCSIIFVLLMPSNVFAADKNLLDESSITLSSDVIPVGGTASLEIRILAEMTSLTYGKLQPMSSDDSILTFEADGDFDYVVKGLKEGTADVIFNVPGWAEERFPITVLSVADYDELMKPSQEEIDFNTYSDQISAIFKYYEITSDAYNQNRKLTNANRKERYIAFNNVIVPNYTKYVIEAKKIKAPNAELQALHEVYLKSIKLQLEALTMMKQALYKPNLSNNSIIAANKKMNEGVKVEDIFYEGINKYKDNYGIEDIED